MKTFRDASGYVITGISVEEMRALENILLDSRILHESPEATQWDAMVHKAMQGSYVYSTVSYGELHAAYDASPWFTKATPAKIIALAEAGWKWDWLADCKRDGSFSIGPRIPGGNADTPEVLAGGEDGVEWRTHSGYALRWLALHRPAVYGTLVEKGLAQTDKCRLCGSSLDDESRFGICFDMNCTRGQDR